MEDSSREAASLSFASLQLLEIVEEIENISEPWTSLYPSTAKSGFIDPLQRKRKVAIISGCHGGP